ncbi:FTSH protease 12 [Artemisia annua]|uniref:FTSH protease 12 n=1 Tax=Artemisia annua TaxID=35608 RepID=A0A2U1M832_ARTAN|nr:FTSH protease 12 [Artemisia annua]
MAVRAPFLNHQATQVSQAYMDALIPDPTPANIRKYKKGLWRKSMPKGLKMKKFIEGPEGTLIHDTSYVGEDAWDDEDDDDATVSKNKINEIIDRDGRLNTENKSKLQEELGLSGGISRAISQLDSSRAKYAIEFDMKEVEKSFREDAKVKSEGPRALWISKRWWRYRPKLPYTYFLEKLECSKVAAVVFTEDLKTLMNEGFPLEYVKKQSHYLLKLVIALLPGILVLWFLRESLFASGAEFTDSEKSGAARINQMLSIARRNMRLMLLLEDMQERIHEEDQHLMHWAQLDGEKEKTGVDRFSLRQAVIFICATNRPDELDLELKLDVLTADCTLVYPMQSREYKFLLVLRTVGYSGADIRNLVNEAGIMAVRRGHTKIYQKDIVDVLDKQLLEGMGVDCQIMNPDQT